MSDNCIETKIYINKSDTDPIEVTFNEKEVFTVNFTNIDKITQYEVPADFTNYVDGTQIIIDNSKISLDQTKVDHDLLLNFTQAEHRIINDTGTSATELWSASKINTQLALKSNTGHSHIESDITDLDKYTQAEVDALIAVSGSLAGLTDVDLTGLANGNLIQYNSSTGKWEAVTSTGGVWGTIIGTLSNQTDLQNALDLKLNIADLNYYTSADFNTDFTAKDLDDLSDGTVYKRSHNDFTNTLKSKLNGIEALATKDQTGAEIKSLYEAEADTNAFTDTLLSKLNNIAENANNYTLPIATNIVLGGVKIGDRISIVAGVISADVQSDENFTSALLSKLNGIEALADVTDVTNVTTALNSINVNALSDITSSGADIEDAVSKKHANTLDHTQNTDVTLTMAGGLELNQEADDGVPTSHYKDYRIGQTFTPTKSGELTKVTFYVEGLGGADLPCEIFAVDSDHKPTGAALASQTVLNANIPPAGSPADLEITFDTPTDVVAGVEYAIVFDCGTHTIYYYNSNKYPGGYYVYKASAPDPWDADATSTFYFKAYVTVVAGDVIDEGVIQRDIGVAYGKTVDGRDLSVDGIKLDGIEALADVTDVANVTTALNSINVNALADITSAGADIEDAVSKKHTQNSDTDLDATFEATFVKKTDTVNVLSDITSTGANIESAVTLKHTQGTDTTLGVMTSDVNMNTHKLTGLSVPSSNGDSIRVTTKITEVNLEDAVDKKHDGSTQDTAIGLNTTHRGSNGSDHSYIDQSVVSGATPVFGIDNLTDGGGLVLITSTQETNFETAYSHSQIVTGNPHAIDITDLTSYAHNSLSNLNTGDYLHLTAAEYAELHVAVTVAGAPLTLTGQQITFNYDSDDFALDGNNLSIKEDGIKDVHIDWGHGAGQINSDDVPDHNGHSVLDTFNHIINRGKTSAITVTLTGGLGISWTSGEIYDEANTLFVATDAGSGSLTDNVVNYLKWVSGTTLTISTSTSGSDEILIATFCIYDGIINCYRETSLMNESVADTRRALRAMFHTRVISGLDVTEDTDVTNALDVVMAAGEYYKDGIKQYTPVQIYSRNTPLVRHFHTAGVWDYDTNAEIDTNNYDNGTDKTAIPANKWVKAYFLLCCDKIGWVYPTAYFTTKAAALDAALPDSPPGLEPCPKLTAIVYQQADADFTNTTWQDIRAGISEESFNLVTEHNDLSGLDTGDYQHLTSAEHDELTQWLDDVTLGASGSLTLPTGQNFTIGSTQWNSGDNIDASKLSGTIPAAVLQTEWDTAYTHAQLTSGNPHSVTPAELSLVIGTDVQAYDAGLLSLAGLTYVSDSFIKVTAEDTYAIRTIAETKTDLSLNNVSNVATDDTAYNEASWNANSDAATKNVIRDQIEIMLTAIGLNTAKNTNVSTTLEAGTVNATTYGITSDGGVDDIVLPEATTDYAGLLGADKWDEIVANSVHTADNSQAHSDYLINNGDDETSGKFGIGMTALCELDVNGRVRTIGIGTDPASGSGMEFLYHTGIDVGIIVCYDRTGSLYEDFEIQSKELTLKPAAGITIGAGTAGVDYALTFDGETNDGILTWMEDEDYFKFSDDVLMNSTERIYHRDTAIYSSSDDDGHYDIHADTSIDLNSNTLITGLGSGTTLSIQDDQSIMTVLLKNNKVAGQGDVALVLDKATNGNSAYLQFSTGGATKWTWGTGVAAIDENIRLRTLGGASVIKANYTGAVDNTLVLDSGNLTIAGNLSLSLDKKIYLGDTAVHIQSDDDGHLDLTADGSIDLNALTLSQNIVPISDDIYYLGEIGSPYKAYKALILKDTTDGKHYKVECISGSLTATALD